MFKDDKDTAQADRRPPRLADSPAPYFIPPIGVDGGGVLTFSLSKFFSINEAFDLEAGAVAERPSLRALSIEASWEDCLSRAA